MVNCERRRKVIGNQGKGFRSHNDVFVYEIICNLTKEPQGPFQTTQLIVRHCPRARPSSESETENNSGNGDFRWRKQTLAGQISL
jgi:hypothetical protein